MNISELRSVLNIVDGKIAGGNISLSGGSLTANLLYLIQKCYDGNLPISSAELTLDDGKGSIKMKGKSPFLGADNIPVAVEFKLESGQVSFSITYDFSGTKTSLKTLLDKYASNIPLPAGLYIDSLGVSAEKMETFAMSLSMAGEPDPWTIPIGPTHLTVSDVGLKLSYKKGGSPGGSFDGKIALGDFATIDMDYTVPADFVIQGNIPNVHLLRLTKQLTNIPLELPADFDISFTDTSIVIKKEGNDYTFQLGTKLADALYLGMQIEKGDAGWGFAAGFDWKKGTVAGNAIGSAIDTFMGLFALSNFMVVVSSLDKADFTFPDFDEFKKPAISAGRITLPSQADGIIPGLNVFAQWVIDKSANDQKFLKKFLSLGDSLGITLQVGKQPTADSRLYVAFKKEICKHELIGEFGGQLKNSQPGLFLSGQMAVSINHQPLTFLAEATFVANGIFIAAGMKGTISFDVFKLSNLGLVIGIDWEMIPSLGVQATIDAGDFESSVAVFFNSANPSQSMVAGAVSNITLKNVFDTLTGVSSSAIDSVLSQVGISGTDPFPIPGSLANDLDHLKLEKVAAAFKDKGYTIPTSTQKTLLVVNTPGSVWHLTNLDSESSGHPTHYQLKKKGGDIEVSVEAQFYCAPQDTQISDLFSYKKGFFINGKIHFFFIEAEASVTVSSNKGFAIDADMDPIIIGNATLFSIKAAKGSGGPKISVATFDQPQEPKEFRSPHFFINGQLEMLGIKDSIYVNLTEKSGLKFDLKTQCISGLTFDLSGHFNALDNMEVKGDVDAEIPTIDLGILGKVNLETGAGGSLDLGVNKKDIYAHIKAHFEFAGQTLTLPIIDLDFEIASLEKLVEKLAGLIKNALKDFLDDAVQWAKYVGEKIIEGVEDVEHVLSEYFKKTPKEIKAILKIAASTCPVASATMLM